MKKIIKLAVLCLLTAALSGCGGEEVPQTASAPASYVKTTVLATETVAAETVIPETIDPAAEAEMMASEPPPPVFTVLSPEASGELVEQNALAVVDYSHTADGYVMVCYTAETEHRLKVLLKGPQTTYSYNLTPGEWTVFPLSDGDGTYQVGIYENVYDSKYAAVLAADCEVELKDEFAPFLRPNQYVNYSDASAVVAKGAELTAGMRDPLEKVAAVYDYVVATLTYDYEKAGSVKSGYLPVLDQVLEEKTGICFDYAALMAAMLRSQEIPCKLVVGFAGETYHAWISVWTQEHGWVDGIIFFDGQVWKRMDPTFASSSQGDPEIMDFIENGNYTVKYLY